MSKRDGLVIAVDFDGTLCRYQRFGDGKITSPPNEGAAEVMKRLRGLGYRLVVFTVRLHPKWGADENESQMRELEAWFERHEIPYDEITNRKPEAMPILTIGQFASPHGGMSVTISYRNFSKFV